MKFTSDSGCLMLNPKSSQSVRRQLRVAGRLEQLTAHHVEGRESLAATASEIEHREVQGQPEQVVAHRLGHELVDVVTDLARLALENAPAACAAVSRPPTRRR